VKDVVTSMMCLPECVNGDGFCMSCWDAKFGFEYKQVSQISLETGKKLFERVLKSQRCKKCKAPYEEDFTLSEGQPD
jgi:hypothetical protein